MTTSEQVLAQAAQEGRAGNLSYAELLCRQVLDAQPERIDALVLLGYLCQVQGRSAECVSLYQRALQLDPHCVEVHNNLGFLYASLGQLDEAVLAYRRALALRPNYAEALNNMGMLHVRQQQYADARPWFEKALAAQPDHAKALANLGHVHLLAERAEEAADCYRRLLRLRPENAEAYHNLGLASIRLNQWDVVIDCWQRSAAIDAGNPQRHCQLGFAYMRLGRRDDALRSYQTALTLAPDDREMQLLVEALSGTASWTQVPADYVTSSFDGYADSFDHDLVDNLAYRGPELLHEALGLAAPHSLDVLDLGCGTGLCGKAFRDTARTLTGIDLSAHMLAKARDQGVYERLIRGELVGVVPTLAPAAFDLVLAGDVLIYLGDLVPLAQAVRGVLRPGGRFAFTVERHEGSGYSLRPTLRFAHSRDYLHELAAQVDMQELVVHEAAIRREHDEEVAGLVVVWAVPG
jgi:predicted TPR repeat methyltransferase